MIYITPMTKARYDRYSEWSVADYAEDLVKSGIAAEGNAYLVAKKEFEEILPNGFNTEGNFFYSVINEFDDDIGMIWYGNDDEEENAAFIYDFLINEVHRRKGYGTKTLALIEEDAKEKGFAKISLNVFKFNTSAYALYKKTGYLTYKEFEGNMTLYKIL